MKKDQNQNILCTITVNSATITGTARGHRRSAGEKTKKSVATAFECVNAVGSLPYIKRHRMPIPKISFFRPLTLHHLNKPDTEDPRHRKAPHQQTASKAAVVNSPLPFNNSTNIVSTPDTTMKYVRNRTRHQFT